MKHEILIKKGDYFVGTHDIKLWNKLIWIFYEQSDREELRKGDIYQDF